MENLYGWSDTRTALRENLVSGVDSEMRAFWTVRIIFDDHGDVTDMSYPRGIEFDIRVVKEKLSLLKLLDVGERIDTVGLRRSSHVFYVRLFEDECMGTGE